MSITALLDLVALIAFVVAAVTIALVPSRTRGIGPQLKIPLLLGFAIYAFVALSNVVEHAGITSALDEYEDYAEILFVPLVAYTLYSRSTAEQLERATVAEQAIRAEHDLLMRVVETTPAGILVIDGTGSVSFANDEARRMLDLRSTADGGLVCVGCEDDGVVRPGGRLDLTAIAGAAPLVGLLQTVDGPAHLSHVMVSATPLTTPGPGTGRAVLVIEDVSERIATESELEEYRQNLERLIDRRTSELLEANRELTEAGQARDRFLANMSHELRTPLNSIIGFTDLLLARLPGPLTDEQVTQLGMVKESSSELLALVTDVLDLARVESGHTTVAIGRVDLGTRVSRLVHSMSALARTRGVDIECRCEQGPEVTSDPDKVSQIVRNLVANAIKFTDRGGSVTVEVGRTGAHAFVRVTDTGIGIAEEDLERIFEAFQQVESADRARPRGTGLGLTISRQLCDLLGCDITVASSPGEGSVFTLLVPLDQALENA